jgi:hypothetical protein
VGSDVRRRRSINKIAFVTGYFFDSQIIDRDFDDDQIDLIALREQIATGRAIQLHPVEGDRRDTMDDPVPLHSHKPDGASTYSEFPSVYLQLKEARRVHAEIRAREKRENEERAARKAQYEEESRQDRERRIARDAQRRVDYLKQFEAKPTDPRPPWVDPWTPDQHMLANLRVTEPLARGIARVWMNYVMVNEDDGDNPTLQQPGVPWQERWRGRGLIIFERLRSRDRMVAESMWRGR